MRLTARAPQLPRAVVLVDVGPEVSQRGAEQIRNFVVRNVEFDDLDQIHRTASPPTTPSAAANIWNAPPATTWSSAPTASTSAKIRPAAARTPIFRRNRPNSERRGRPPTVFHAFAGPHPARARRTLQHPRSRCPQPPSSAPLPDAPPGRSPRLRTQRPLAKTRPASSTPSAPLPDRRRHDARWQLRSGYA